MSPTVYVSYFRTLEHTFALFQVTFICKQTSSENFILQLLFSTTGKTEMRNIVKSSGFSGTIRERSWSRNVFFKNSKVLTEFKCYFWLKFGLMVFANIHTVGNTLSPAICFVISSIGVTVRILFCLPYQDLQSLDMSITFWLLCKHNRVNQVVSWSPDDALGFHSFWKGDKSISKYH